MIRGLEILSCAIRVPIDTAPVGLGLALGSPPKLAQVPTAMIRAAFMAASRKRATPLLAPLTD